MDHEVRTPMNAVLGMPGLLESSELDEHPRTCIVHAMHVYWVRAASLQTAPDTAALRQQGVVLHALESVEVLASRLEAGATIGLLVVDHANATSAALRALCRSSTRMQSMPMIALADSATEEEMLACLQAGAVDMVPKQFALHHLQAISNRYLDVQGKPRVDIKQNIAAIDSQRAMAQMQADVAFFSRLLRTFFDELPGRKKQFQDHWHHNPQHIKNLSHALKGLSLTLGLHQLAAVAVQAQTQAAQGACLDAAELGRLEGELQSAGFQILRWLQLHTAVIGTPQ
jgi:CheY-like chemotaxis protein